MSLVKVNSWSILSAQGGYHRTAPKDILINVNNIVAVETRITPYNTTGVTNILYEYSENNSNTTLCLIVTDLLATVGTNAPGLISVGSWNDLLQGTVFSAATTVLMNPWNIIGVRTLDVPLYTTGITAITYAFKQNDSIQKYSVVVTDTLDAINTAAAGSGGGGSVTWASITGKPTTFAPIIGTTSTTAKAGDYTPPNASTSVKGIVNQAATQANSTATDAAGVVTDFNALLAKLRTAGLLAP